MATIFGFTLSASVWAQNSARRPAANPTNTNASLDWQKIRFEEILNEKVRSTLAPLLGKDNFVFSASVKHRAISTAESQIKTSTLLDSSTVFDNIEDSVLLGRLGLNEEIYNELLDNNLINSAEQRSVLDYVTAIDGDLIVDPIVSNERVQRAVDLANKILGTYYKKAKTIEAKRETLKDPTENVPVMDNVLNKILKVSLPLAVIIFLVGALGLLLVAKKIPSVDSTHRHKMDLDHARRRRAVLAKQEKENSAPTPDGPNDFLLNRELSERLLVLCKAVDQDVIKVMVEKWYLEGEAGWKKGIFVAKAWNEIRPTEPVRLQSNKGILDLFKRLAEVSYRDRNVILEGAVNDIIAAQSLGTSVFEEKFGFLLCKPFEVQLEAFKQLDSRSGQLAILSQLPAESKPLLLEELQTEDREELFNDLLSTKFIQTADIDNAVFKLRQSVSKIEDKLSGAGRIDLSTHRISLIQSLSVKEEIRLLPKMMEKKPALREWLKLSYLGLSLFAELKPETAIQLTKDLNNNRMVDLLLSLPLEVANNFIGYQPKLKAAVVDELYRKAQANNQESNWNFLNDWLKGLRTNLEAKENFKYRLLYTAVDEDLAKTVDSGADFEISDEQEAA